MSEAGRYLGFIRVGGNKINTFSPYIDIFW